MMIIIILPALPATHDKYRVPDAVQRSFALRRRAGTHFRGV
jgi:hypothetical protein